MVGRIVGDIKNKNILFLQGPMGFFFKKLDDSFRKQGATTYKIGFNMGDYFFSNKDKYTPFREKPQDWPEFIENFLIKNKIDKIFLFGDCRFYQKEAKKIAYKYNIEVFVFEEGYIRPHYITLEKFGVNGFSNIPRDPKFFYKLKEKPLLSPKPANPSKTNMILSASTYYALSNLFSFKYPHYIHHREFSAIKELFYGIRGVIRKGIFKITERNYEKLISTTLSKKYYFVPLQTHNDFQILQHSPYQSIEKFIIEVLESFAKYAPKKDYIIFKHHPVDRGRKNYKEFILEQAKILGVEKRVLIFYDVYLPTCLKNAKATVTVNSTVGLTSIGYGIPTKTLGNAIYDVNNLTNKDISLDKFWKNYRKPNRKLYKKFTQYIIENTQLNGSFYGLFPKELEEY